MDWLTVTAGLIVVVFIGVAGAIILWYLISEKIDLTKLISEENGTASLSRFQFLIFTFVIAMSLFLLVVNSISGDCSPCEPKFPAIPAEVLGLLGISGGSYVISKGIQKSGGGGASKGTNGKDDGDKEKDEKPKEPTA